MHKILYGLALAAAALGLYEASYALEGSHAQIEAGLLLISAPILLAAGVIASRITQKTCPACSERIKKTATVCKHCKSSAT